ncbi:N-acetylmuramoyl-L-alanine amidase [Chitinophaga pinensis]|uniref:N-acetylmuramoyl-L-alanine amidase n=1 Tax=Chitinophaga pinensis (strain ATCC 43595 / DSM 2588 / LMG 13176 / NBRC 15968 / NCIMB 11800 / UQM 2034) TaxID=485918 RepID=A0A979GTX4_CHIPD|nr:N-acetylmuramoyl-L-alanine amidase [Chitinophaga pinensis]ACU58955.1 N-acetylmuramyl-L-alanine amidase, negative regulator of AmpC, AmpD [Chitinophaga pinensis DSM 2588]
MKAYSRLLLWVIAAAVYGCAPKPYATTNKLYRQQAKQYAATLRTEPAAVPATGAPTAVNWIGTTNFNLRKPNYVIIHHTAQGSCDTTFNTFTLPRTQVSAHYVICKDGTINHMLNDYLRAWHAGIAKWGNVTDMNSCSIGIELDNNGLTPFQPQQINSLLVLLDSLKHRFNIPAANFIGHGDIAPGRKVDPSAWFPWQQLAEKGFGLWYGDTSKIIIPGDFSSKQALRIVGYDTRDTVAAIKAFKRHFVPTDTTNSTSLDEGERKILFSLMEKSE